MVHSLRISSGWGRIVGVFAFALLIFSGEPSLFAQSVESWDGNPASRQYSNRWVPSLHTMGRDALEIVGAPVTLSRSQGLLALGASGIVVGAISALDRPAYRAISIDSGPIAEATGPLAAPGRWYDRIGPDRVVLGTAGLLAAGGVALERKTLTRTSVRVLEAVVYTKAVTGFAKGLISRSRPFVGATPFRADPGEFGGEHAELSMPSGHTARAFAVASVLAHRADRWYVSVLSYGGAASVGLERIRSGDHWLTDVIVGGALGYLIGRSVTPSETSSDGPTYTPLLSVDRVGLTIRF